MELKLRPGTVTVVEPFHIHRTLNGKRLFIVSTKTLPLDCQVAMNNHFRPLPDHENIWFYRDFELPDSKLEGKMKELLWILQGIAKEIDKIESV